jgi:nucleotide-binding universal stress UspA family protein
MFARILVPLDDSHLSEAALEVAGRLASGSGAEVTLLTVGERAKATRRRREGVPRPVPTGTTFGGIVAGAVPATPARYAETKDQATEREEHELLERLERPRQALRAKHETVRTAARIGDPAEEIIDFVRHNNIELIVMATHGRSGLSERLHGSVTEKVLRSGVAPVLVVRPTA